MEVLVTSQSHQGDRPGSGISDSLFHALLALLSQDGP